MNIREGMRRLGIVLGVIGCAIGALFGCESAEHLWNAHTTHQRFQALLGSPTMLSLAKDVGWLSTENRKKADEIVADPDFRKLSNEEQKYILERVISRGLGSAVLASAASSDEDHVIDVPVNLDGVKKVKVDKLGRISLIELSTAESISRTEQPTLMAFVCLILYPIGGFLAPWGAIRALVWLAAGFRSK